MSTFKLTVDCDKVDEWTSMIAEGGVHIYEDFLDSVVKERGDVMRIVRASDFNSIKSLAISLFSYSCFMRNQGAEYMVREKTIKKGMSRDRTKKWVSRHFFTEFHNNHAPEWIDGSNSFLCYVNPLALTNIVPPKTKAPTLFDKEAHLEPNDKHGNQVDFRETKDGATLTVKSLNEVKTVDDLLDYAEVDRDVWEVATYAVNNWPMGYTTKDSDGKKVANDHPLYQISAKLKRIVSSEEEIKLKNHVINIRPFPKAKEPDGSGIMRIGIIPDIQIGFLRHNDTQYLEPLHDRVAVDLAYQILNDANLDAFVVIGDMADLVDCSTFERSRNLEHTIDETFAECIYLLGQFRALAPQAYFIEGNHEARLAKHLIRRSPALLGVSIGSAKDVSFATMANLDSLDYTQSKPYPHGEFWFANGDVRMSHGTKAGRNSGATASTLQIKSSRTEIVGHCHKSFSASMTIHEHDGPRFATVHSPGCLCRLDDVVPSNTGQKDWQQGVSILHINEKENMHRIENIIFDKGRCLWKDKMYVGRDYEDEIARDTKRPWLSKKRMDKLQEDNDNS